MDVVAPLSGVLSPLGSNPDPVFAGRLAGDGVCIDPTTCEVVAPVAGRVSVLHPSRHAFAIEVAGGAEILVHVGVDTVALHGKGFTALVGQGDRVAVGQPVLRFDADAVARTARSLLTVVLVTDAGRLCEVVNATGLAVAGRTRLFTVDVAEAGTTACATPSPGAVRSRLVRVPNRLGLHARPAAVLVVAAKKHPGLVRIVRGDRAANAKSLVSVLGLSIGMGDLVAVEAEGECADTVAEDLATLVEQGCGEGEARRPARRPEVPAGPRVAPTDRAIPGITAAPGLAIGRVHRLRDVEFAPDAAGRPPEQEQARLDAAIEEARAELAALIAGAANPASAGILGVQLELLDDPELRRAAAQAVSDGSGAASAWHAAVEVQADALSRLDNPILQARATDLRDVGRRVVQRLAGAAPEPPLPDDAIVVAREVTPSQMSAFDRARLAGLCTTTGSPTSHLAIMARNAGVPALCAADERVLSLPEGTEVILDGERAVLVVGPDGSERGRARARLAVIEAERVRHAAGAAAEARTRDGHRVDVVANITGPQDVGPAIANGAEGVGLYRSEFLFHGRPAAPTEDEQATAYRGIAQALGPHRPLVIRTLDVGGDKPLPWLQMPPEENPFLGVRGIRVSLEHEDLFRVQLRAIARAADLGNVHVMFPMISSLDEVRAAKRMLLEELAPFGASVAVGIMVEVPSAAVMAETLAREVDFLSIGTNDLTQYVLAMDRCHPKLAPRADGLHPAVLKMIEMTVRGALPHGRRVAVCGGMASDPVAVPVLVGLGVHELSVSVPSIPAVKAALAAWSLDECRALAREVVGLDSPEAVRAALAAAAPARMARAAEG